MANYIAYSDTELAGLLQSGDRNAFAEIYDRYKFILHHHAWVKTGNHEDAQDTIQEVFAMVWNKRAQINIGANLSGYLYTCVRNHILNAIVRKDVQGKYIASIQQFQDQQHPVVTDHLVRENMLREMIEKEVAALPPRMREVFELSRKQHLSHKQIAELMGTSEQTVKKQMTNALKILRGRLGLFNYLALFFIFR